MIRDAELLPETEEVLLDETMAPSEQRSWVSLLWGIIVQPVTTFTYIRDHGGRVWLLVALLAIITAMAPVVASVPVMMRQAQEAQAAFLERFPQSSPQPPGGIQPPPVMGPSATQMILFPTIANTMGLLLGWLVWTTSFHLVGIMIGARNTFGQMFRVQVWASIPIIIRNILQGGYILLTGNLILNPGLSGMVQTPIPPPGEPGVALTGGQIALRAILAPIDLYLFWNLFLLIIGVGVTTRLSRRKSAIFTLLVWLTLMLLGMAPTLLTGFFMGTQSTMTPPP